MKKLLLTLAASVFLLVSSQAQNRFAQNGPRDNWYAGANVGFNSKLTHNNFMTHLNPDFTLRLGRDIIPIVGVMAEFTTFFNDQQFPGGKVAGQDYFSVYSHTIVKAFDVNLLGSLNLHNLFKGYPGYQRFFEARFLAGIGMNHVCGIDTKPKNDFIAKFGFDFTFNLDKFSRVKGFEAYVEPAMNFNLNRYSEHVEFNPNCAAWQLAIGVNYRFNNLHKKRREAVKAPTPSAEPVVQVTQAITPVPEEHQPVTVTVTKKPTITITTVSQEPTTTAPVVDVPTAKASEAKPAKPTKTAPATKQTPAAKQASATKQSPAKKTTTPAVAVDNTSLPTIQFKAGESAIPDNQYDALTKVANYMKNHPRAHLVIKGQGNRADAVKNALTRRFGINATRLSTASGATADTVTFAER